MDAGIRKIDIDDEGHGAQSTGCYAFLQPCVPVDVLRPHEKNAPKRLAIQGEVQKVFI
jgi:hypothetical protein